MHPENQGKSILLLYCIVSIISQFSPSIFLHILFEVSIQFTYVWIGAGVATSVVLVLLVVIVIESAVICRLRR